MAGEVTTGVRILESLVAADVVGGPLAIALQVLDRAGELTDEVATRYVARAFDSCAHPSTVLDIDDWIWLFLRAGFTREWAPAGAPSQARRVYRGAPPEHMRGLSWTTDLAVARGFAARRPGGVVATAVATPAQQLAELAVGWEDQVVVDTRDLEIEGEYVR